MKTVTIGFGYTQNIGEYEAWKVYEEVQVEPNENPHEVFDLLKEQVKSKLLRPDQMRGVAQELVKAREEIDKLNNQIWTFKKKYQEAEYNWKHKIVPKWEQAKTILAVHGVEIPQIPSIHFDSDL